MNSQNLNSNVLNHLRIGLHSSLRDQSSCKSVQQQISSSKAGKSRHFGVLQQLKKREEDWNERFYVQQIPMFKFQSTKNPKKGSTKNSNNSSNIQEVSFQPGRIRRVTQESLISIPRPSTSQFQYQEKQNENNSGIVNKYIKELQTKNAVRPPSVNYSSTHPYPNAQQKTHILQENNSLVQQTTIPEETIRNLKIQINKYWEEFNIPDFHRMLYVECTKQFKKKQFLTIVQQEIQSLKDRKSYIQTSLRALKARQQCLKTINELIGQEQQNEENLSEQVQNRFGELIIHLRILTLNVVESILRWRDYLSQLLLMSCKQKIQNILFLHLGDNYLLMLQHDYTFICESFLCKYFSFSKGCSDPFFLAAQQSRNKQIESNPLKNDVLQRIRASELILLEEKIYDKLEQSKKELSVHPLGLFEDEVDDFLSNYLKEIPTEIKNSFIGDHKKLLNSVLYEQELNWIKLCSNHGKQMQGLCIFYVDKNCFTSRRIILTHVSSLNIEQFEKTLQKCVQFIWRNDYCDEIRTTLHYQHDEHNEYKINIDIQNHLKAIGFKWKQLFSEKDTGLKTTIFGMSRPQGLQKGSTKLSNQEPISFKQLSILTDEHILDIPELKIISYDSSLIILNLLSKLKCSSKILEKVLQLSPSKKKYSPPGTKEQSIQLKAQIKEQYECIFDGEEASKHLQVLEEQAIQSQVTQTKLCYRWLNFHTFKLENYTHSYIRIKIDQQNQQFYITASSTKSQSPIYLIPTDDKQVVAFVINLSNEETNSIKQGKLNEFIYEVFNDSKKNQVINDELWIPSFKKSIDFHNVPIEVEENSYDNSSQIISKVLLSTEYQQPIQASLQIKQPSQKAYIFQAPFIFGLIKADDLDLPLLSCLIEKEDLV